MSEKLDLEPFWLKVALAEIGVAELPGELNSARILKYHAQTTLNAKSDEIPWCSSFLCFIFESVKIKSTRSALARSWLNWGVKSNAVPGSVLVFKRGKPWQGHVALLKHANSKGYWCVGGNQQNRVNIKCFEKNLLLDARWPAYNDLITKDLVLNIDELKQKLKDKGLDNVEEFLIDAVDAVIDFISTKIPLIAPLLESAKPMIKAQIDKIDGQDDPEY